MIIGFGIYNLKNKSTRESSFSFDSKLLESENYLRKKKLRREENDEVSLRFLPNGNDGGRPFAGRRKWPP